MAKICEMLGVREYRVGLPVELSRDADTDRLVIHASTGADSVDIDLFDLFDWLANGPRKEILRSRYKGED